jgi:hypothetical protein
MHSHDIWSDGKCSSRDMGIAESSCIQGAGKTFTMSGPSRHEAATVR